MSDGVTCRDCHGRIDEGAFEMKRKLHARLHAKDGKPWTPPKLCSECWLLALHRLCFADDDETDAKEGGT